MRQKAFDYVFQKSCVGRTSTHEMHTPYRGRQGPCIWLGSRRVQRAGGDKTECLMGMKLIYQEMRYKVSS